MYQVITEAATAPTEVMWRRLAASMGVPQGEAARARASAAYLADADKKFARLKEKVEARQRGAEVSQSVRRWIDHIAQHAEKIADGWRPLLDELTPSEWRGLALLRGARQRFSDAHVQCPGCGRAIPRGATGDACGWAEEGKRG